MACIEHYIKDAENIYVEIKYRQKQAGDNAYAEYKAARTIQRHFRGYITRKHIKYLHNCAMIIQRNWRGFVDRRRYRQLLQDAVHKMYLEHYNSMASIVQRVWRGHYVRKNVFSFYEMKKCIQSTLEKNREFLELAKMYQNYKGHIEELNRQQKCQELLTELSFRIHHLIRTHQIEGVYSKRDTFQYSAIEQHLKDVTFMNHTEVKQPQKLTEQSKPNYIFEGKLHECEKVWLQRNDPGKYGLDTGEYGQDEIEAKIQQKTREKLLQIQDKPMCFKPMRYNDVESKLNFKEFKCPPLHRGMKKVHQ